MSGAGRPGAFCGLAPARRTGLRAGGGPGPGSISALSSVSGLGTKAASWLDLPRGMREKDRTGQAGGCAGVPCLLSTHLGAGMMRPLSSTLPCPRPAPRPASPGVSGWMQARQGQWETVGGALRERVWAETQEGREGGRRGPLALSRQCARAGPWLRAVHASGREGGEGALLLGVSQVSELLRGPP